MKKLILTLAATACMLSATAQRLLVIDSLTIDVNDVDYISYEADPDSPYKLLPEAIAADPKTTIFGQALQLTGLADSIMPYKDRSYDSCELRDLEKRIRATNGSSQYSWAIYISTRWQRFTAFVETDSVFQVAGINNLQDLQAYAKRVYDEVYPEDASVSDPTDRRHSLNRFVAYHLLPFSSGYRWLVSANYYEVAECMPGTVRDASAYYETLMPQASLKCSYPRGANPTGIYLNRSGLRRDYTVRGAYIMGIDYFKEHYTDNGSYYYIDQPLVYDRTTQQEVLNELWRVDFKTLSPDLMNTAMVSRWGYYDYFFAIPNGYAMNYETDGEMVALRPFDKYNSSSNRYEGDEVVCPRMRNVTVKLPPLPVGTWQVRLGYNCGTDLPVINTYIDEVLQFSNLDLRQNLTPEDIAADDNLFPGPDDYFPGGYNVSLADKTGVVCRVIGTLTSTGTGDHYLRIENITDYYWDKCLPLDYLEFVPVK